MGLMVLGDGPWDHQSGIGFTNYHCVTALQMYRWVSCMRLLFVRLRPPIWLLFGISHHGWYTYTCVLTDTPFRLTCIGTLCVMSKYLNMGTKCERGELNWFGLIEDTHVYCTWLLLTATSYQIMLCTQWHTVDVYTYEKSGSIFNL